MRALVVLALAAALANAASISWTGIAGDNQWTNHINWYPAQVPGPSDDVSIPSGVVQCTIATGVNSLTMGVLVTAPANLTLFQGFVVGNGGMTVDNNGNLIVNTGLSQVFGQVTIGGTLQFIDGVLGGAWTIAKGAFANLGNANEKGFSGAAFVSQGTLTLGGVIVLNQTSSFTLQSATSATTNLIIQNGDGSDVVFDASAASFTYSTGLLTVQAPVKLGAFTLVSGNITILDSLAFTQSLNVPQNSYVTCLGDANLNASTGLTGAGVVTISCKAATLGGVDMTGYLNVAGGNALFATSSNIGILTLAGGSAVFMATVYPAQLNLLNGLTAGTGVVNAAQLLLQSNGFVLGSKVTVNKTASIMASTLSFGQTGALEIAAFAVADVAGALNLNGAPNVPGLTNNGIITLRAMLASQNINIRGSGAIIINSGLTASTATISQASITMAKGALFAGSITFLNLGKVASADQGVVTAVLGDYTIKCNAECLNVVTPNSQAPTASFAFSAQ